MIIKQILHLLFFRSSDNACDILIDVFYIRPCLCRYESLENLDSNR